MSYAATQSILKPQCHAITKPLFLLPQSHPPHLCLHLFCSSTDPCVHAGILGHLCHFAAILLYSLQHFKNSLFQHVKNFILAHFFIRKIMQTIFFHVYKKCRTTTKPVLFDSLAYARDTLYLTSNTATTSQTAKFFNTWTFFYFYVPDSLYPHPTIYG
jgi:hypothetical protein